MESALSTTHLPDVDADESATVEKQAEQVRQLEESIQQRAYGTIKNLSVEVRGDVVVISGRTSKFYYKQLAGQAVMERFWRAENEIEVR